MKKISLLLCALLASLVLVTSCKHDNGSGKGGNNPQPNPNDEQLKPEEVTTEQGKAIIEEHKGNENFILLDVRTDAEFAEGWLKSHLEETEDEPHKGILQHDIYAPDINSWLLALDKSKRYLLYCRTQVRSKKAFDILKAAGFKKIQYMHGGYTEWRNKNFPVITPEFEKAVDVQIKGDKIKTKDNIKFDFVLTNLKGNPLRKAKLHLEILQGNTKVDEKDIDMGNSGEGSYIFDATSKTKGAYRLVCKGTHKGTDGNAYKPGQAHYYFEVADADEAVSGNADEIKIEDDITTDITKKFYNRNIYGYEVYDKDQKVTTLEAKIDKTKPTMVIFFSPKCGGCMVKAKELIKYKLDSINVLPVITSVDEAKLADEIAYTEKEFRNTYGLGELVPTTLYDAKDKIWLSRFHFGTTPKFVLINKEGQIKDIVHGGETLAVEALLKKMQDKFGLPAFEKK